jgi:hypothetical protein
MRLARVGKKIRSIEKVDKSWMKNIFENIRFTPNEISQIRGKFARSALHKS